jgi:hypothetical protein
MGTTAEIKPFEPETGNAGVGKMKMQNTFLYTFFGAIRTDIPKWEQKKAPERIFRYVSGKYYLNSNYQQIQRKTY